MYCPKCAAQNVEGSKFCRSCGTNLEAVALALTDKPNEKDSNWYEKRGKGARLTVQGMILTGSSLLIGVALALSSNNPAWILIWLTFVGWMACWGIIALMLGIGNFLESSIMLRHSEKKSLPNVFSNQLISTDNLEMISSGLTTSQLSLPSSITEQTTRSLDKKHSKSKHTS